MKNKLLNWIAILAGLILIISLSRSLYQLWQRRSVVDEAWSRVRVVEEENALLREQYREVNREEYIERMARDKLGMAKEGEVIVVLPDNGSATGQGAIVASERNEREEADDVPVWQQWVAIFL